MMKRYILLLIPLLFCSCNDSMNDSGYSSDKNTPDAIVGKWYSEDVAAASYQEDTYTNTGIKYSTTYRQMYGYQPYRTHGKYTLTGNQMTENMTFDGTSTSVLSVWTVDSVSLYSYVTHNVDYGKSHYNRIIGSVIINKGKEYNLEAAQYFARYSKVIPDITSYSVVDESILDVDNTGTITPKLSGDTYIKVHSSQGMAVIKASVIDSTSLWNDYSHGLGLKLPEVERIYGKYYAYKNDSTILYCPQHYYVDSVKFVCNESGVIDSIAVVFSKYATDDIIAGNLNSTMVLVNSLVSDTLCFTDNANYLMSKTTARYKRNSRRLALNYLEPEWEDKIEDFGLTYDELKKKYGCAKNYTGRSADYGNIIKNEFISQIQYEFDKESNYDKVNCYIIFFGNRITKDMLEYYMQRNYFFFNSTIPYAKNVVRGGKECLIRANPSFSERRIRYYFDIFN